MSKKQERTHDEFIFLFDIEMNNNMQIPVSPELKQRFLDMQQHSPDDPIVLYAKMSETNGVTSLDFRTSLLLAFDSPERRLNDEAKNTIKKVSTFINGIYDGKDITLARGALENDLQEITGGRQQAKQVVQQIYSTACKVKGEAAAAINQRMF